MRGRKPLYHKGFRRIPLRVANLSESARTVLKTVEPLSGFRGFESHSLRRERRVLFGLDVRYPGRVVLFASRVWVSGLGGHVGTPFVVRGEGSNPTPSAASVESCSASTSATRAGLSCLPRAVWVSGLGWHVGTPFVVRGEGSNPTPSAASVESCSASTSATRAGLSCLPRAVWVSGLGWHVGTPFVVRGEGSNPTPSAASVESCSASTSATRAGLSCLPRAVWVSGVGGHVLPEWAGQDAAAGDEYLFR